MAYVILDHNPSAMQLNHLYQCLRNVHRNGTGFVYMSLNNLMNGVWKTRALNKVQDALVIVENNNRGCWKDHASKAAAMIEFQT